MAPPWKVCRTAAAEIGSQITGRTVLPVISRLRQTTTPGLNGHDAVALILSSNVSRRNLTKGQQAMALAFAYPEGSKGGRLPRSAKLFTPAKTIPRLDQPSLIQISAAYRALSQPVVG